MNDLESRLFSGSSTGVDEGQYDESEPWKDRGTMGEEWFPYLGDRPVACFGWGGSPLKEQAWSLGVLLHPSLSLQAQIASVAWRAFHQL